ncbi:MAG TPA: TetR family transcriptional regulator [Flavobacterium sp.]|jgi:AcrR family transcriptional regulator
MADFNDKQVRILQVAEKLFAERGFDGTSIRNISKEARINIAMVSYYFGSKEKLLERLILFRINDLKVQLENLSKELMTPIQKMEKFIELYIQKLNDNRHMYQILHFETASKKRVMDLKGFQEVKKGNLQSLTNIITEGQEQNLFRKDITIPLITPTILGTYFQFYNNKPFYENVLGLKNQEEYEHYIKNELTTHIQQTIKALLMYEK